MTLPKINCWEYKECGRQPGGPMAGEMGVCPAADDTSYSGINSGKCGGRFCWAVAGTFCGGQIQGTFAEKRDSCLTCDFFNRVQAEEGTANLRKKFLRFVFSSDKSPLLAEMRYRHIKKGERFIAQGEVGDSAYIIQRGSCLVIVEKSGRLHPAGHRVEGDIVGMTSILTGEVRNAHVEAETDMDVWCLEKTLFEDISRKDPGMLEFMTEIVADRFDSRRPTADRSIGRYIATEIIGRGGFSIVYKGVHAELDTPVAIKMMRHDLAMDAEFLKNFRDEAKIIAGFDHENIVKVYDTQERFQTVFIIMEYLEGESLQGMLLRLKSIPAMRVAGLLIQVCRGLEYAHRQGIVHRDINPMNLLVQPDNRVKIIDFGLACPIGTEDIHMGGALPYLAPELLNGEPASLQSDIYALGITAYEMVTGTRPYPEDSASALMKVRHTRDIPDPAESVPDLPEALRRFILKACRRDPQARYQNMGRVLEDLGYGKESFRDRDIERRSQRQNCWEYMQCGRGPGGEKAETHGICPAASDPAFDGVNLGRNAGRICWLAAGTFCNGKVQGTYAEKRASCKHCDFYKQTHAGEGTTDLQSKRENIYAITHMGRIRTSNEDRYLIKKLPDRSLLLAVADGLGGEVAGDYAAEITRGRLAGIEPVPEGNEQPCLEDLVKKIDRSIFDEAQKNPDLEGMGSTLIGVLLRGAWAHWVHVGDSRFYVWRENQLMQVTEDQTFARFLLEEGEITPQQAPTHYSRHILDQCVGCGISEPETGVLEVQSQDLLILSTDGLHKEIPFETMVSLLGAETDLETKAKSLAQAALDAGGKDNITLVIVEV